MEEINDNFGEDDLQDSGMKEFLRVDSQTNEKNNYTTHVHSKKTVATVKELVRDFEFLRIENNKLKDKIEDQNSVIDFLKKTAEQRESYVLQLKQEIKKLRLSAKQEFELFAEEMKTKTMEDEYKIKSLTLEKNRLEDEVNIYKFYERENAELRDTVKNLQEQLEKLNMVNALESETSILEMEKWKKQLEMDFEAKLQENANKAYKELDKYSKDAIQENIRVTDMLSLQNTNLESVLNRLKNLQLQNEKLKKDNQENQQEALRQSSSVRDLHNRLLHEQEKIKTLEDDLFESRSQNADFEVLYTELEVMADNLNRIHDKYKIAKTEMEKWRSRALALKHVDKNLTPRRISKLLEARDDIMESARRTAKQIQEKKAEELKSNISVVQALSMWNSNFSSQAQLYNNETASYDLQQKTPILPQLDVGDNTEKVFNVEYDSNLNGYESGTPVLRQNRKQYNTEDKRKKADKSISVLSKSKKRSVPPNFIRKVRSSEEKFGVPKGVPRFLVP